MIAFISCGQKIKSQQTENQSVVVVDSIEKQDTINSSVSLRDTIIDNYKYTIKREKKDTTFYAFLNYENEYKKFIVKQTQTTERTMEDMYYYWSEIKVEIYDSLNNKKLRSFTKNIDEIKLCTNYAISIINGCCGKEDEGEIFDIWQDKTLLKFSPKYYMIEKQDNTILFLGYIPSYKPYDDSEIYGEFDLGYLYLAHKYVTNISPTLCYGNLVNKVIIRARDIKLKSNAYYLPNIKTSSDFVKVIPSSDGFSYNRKTQQLCLLGKVDYNNFTALKLHFVENLDDDNMNKIVSIPIKIQNNYIFGNKNREQIIYLDDYIKK